MHHQKLNNDTLLFVGEAYESAATAFINGNELFLVDALASLEDARWMQHVIEDQGLEVTFIATTHYMSDHMAGIGLFPRATTIAHENYRHTFLSQNVRVDGFYTVCAGDNIVGNIVYLSKADPCQIDAAIEKVQQLNRKWVISAHMGLFPASTLGNARYYLAKLRDRVVAIRRQSSDGEVANQTLQVRIEDCLPVDVTPTAFEREWHQNNLRLIRDQGVFDLDAFDSLPACG